MVVVRCDTSDTMHDAEVQRARILELWCGMVSLYDAGVCHVEIFHVVGRGCGATRVGNVTLPLDEVAAQITSQRWCGMVSGKLRRSDVA